MIKIRKSLAFKLALALSGSCTLLLLAIFVVNYRVSRKMILQSVEENARNLTLRTVNRIAAVTISVQKVPDNTARLLENETLSDAQLLRVLHTVAEGDKDTVGMSALYAPGAFRKGLNSFAPYYYKAGGKIAYSDIPGYELEDYYSVPRELAVPVWSEPYIDPDAKVLMVTYSVPFYGLEDGKRKFRGVLGVDVSLEWLQGIVSSIKVLKTGDAFLISKNGTIITHPDKNLIMNETIFSVAEARRDPVLRDIGRKMIHGESGFVRFTSLGRHEKSWMCFAPVPSTGWSLGVIFPEAEIMADITRLTRIGVGIGAAGILLLILIIIAISRSITGPLHGMAKAAACIGAGNLDAPLPDAPHDDEVGQLSTALCYMKGSLKKYISDLKETTAAKERIESELSIAREIQTSMLPHIFPAFPHKKEFDLYAMMEPAKEVGGDFYDFILTAENKLFFLIGDVSGKGVPAALFMMITKTLMKNEALQQLPPDEVLRKVNNIVALDNDSSMFATIFCGVLDTETGEVEFSNAGHNPPLVCRKGRPSEFLKMDHGFVLGPMTNSKFTPQKMRLEAGDMLFMYTDGVTEAMNPRKELFSEKRLQAAMAEMCDKDVMALVGSIQDELRVYAGTEPQSDDITMLALKFKGKAV